jgi:hypothetical protein
MMIELTKIDARQARLILTGALFAIAAPMLLIAATPGGAQFAPIYTGLVALMTGIPGKIGVILFFALSLFQVTRGGFGSAALFIVLALALANIGTIVDAFFSATLPVPA